MSATNQTKTAQRLQLRKEDAEDPARLHRSMNDILLALYPRLEALETASSIIELEDVTFEVGGSISPTAAPFAGGALRVACPVGTPSGLIMLRLERQTGGQPVNTNAVGISWHFASGPSGSNNAIVIDFVVGLVANSKYRMRLGVTRHA